MRALDGALLTAWPETAAPRSSGWTSAPARPTLDDRAVRDTERRRLAHELHDNVTHQLSNVVLRTMGCDDDTDPVDLQTVLEEVSEAARAALVELRRLALVLDEDESGPVDALAGLCRDLRPSAAAASWRRRLYAAGFVAGCTVPAAADRLAPSVQSSVTRTFEAMAAAVLRGAAPGARCSAAVHVEPTRVVVRTTTTAAGGLGTGPLEPELRGLRARVDLTRGRLASTVGESSSGAPQWVVTVVLPLD